MVRKGIELLLIIFLIILTPLLISLSSFQSTLTDNAFFYKEFTTYHVQETLPIEANNLHNQVMTYLLFEKKQVLIPSDTFNQKEKIHLLDVKDLLQKTILLWKLVTLATIFSLFILISLEKEDKKILSSLIKVFFIGSALTLLITFSVGFLFAINFDQSFVSFHELFFTNNFWMLNPKVDMLKALYPDELFQDFALLFFTKTIIFSFLMLITSIAIFKYSRRRKKEDENNSRKLENEQNKERNKPVLTKNKGR